MVGVVVVDIARVHVIYEYIADYRKKNYVCHVLWFTILNSTCVDSYPGKNAKLFE